MKTPRSLEKFACLLGTTLILFALTQQLRADHGGPNVETVAELIDQFEADLDELADEFFIEPGEQPNFDEPFFNRLVGRARITLEIARFRVARGRVCSGMFWLTHTVRLLDRATKFGIAQNMSGFGFTDDLASLAAARAQFFLEDLIVLASEDPSVPELALQIAIEAEDEGDDLGGPDSGNWTPALRLYTRGVCILMWFLR